MTEPDVEMGVPGPGWYTGNQPGRIDDRKLVRQALAGDERACSIIVERYTPAVMGCIAGKVRSRSDMEDLAQEVFLRAFRFLHTLRDQERFAPWLMGIARRSVADYYRRHGRRLQVIPSPDGDENQRCPLENFPDPAPGPADRLMARQEREIVLEELARLGEKYRVVLYMRLVGEESSSDIARLMGLAPDAVRKRLLRGMEQLRKGLRRRGLHLDAGMGADFQGREEVDS
ncbi:MAG: sigma-70 family RNA polymerase sigma factor [Candidatus Hydrogenedentes bacterium]|nr:sigma-70 family RNA polymerase sigma factor [Candidatus Hydrogenedentota bacterium]